MKKNKMLVPKNKQVNMLKELEKEIQEEQINKIKTKAKDLIKQIRMTEILLEKQNKELELLLKGEKQFSEEELLFED